MLKFKKHKTPKNLLELYNFDQSIDDSYIDFSFVNEEDEGVAILAPNQKERLLVFGEDGTGSLYAFWFYKKNLLIDNAPIVYLNSEGGNQVVAKSIEEFLGLLIYDTSFFTEAIVYWDSYQSMPNEVIPPEDAFNSNTYESLLTDLMEAHPNYGAFKDLIENKMKIPIPPNPYDVIIQNLQVYAEFNSN